MLAPSGAISAGNWYHLAFVWTGASVTFYVNGQERSTVTSSFDFGPANGDFGIAARFLLTYGNGFDGLIDDVALFDVALTQAHVTALAEGAIPGAPPVSGGSMISIR